MYNIVKRIIMDAMTVITPVKNNAFEELGREYGEAVALYLNGKYDAIASDDDVVRENRTLLNLKVIGTTSIVKWMFEEGIIANLNSASLREYVQPKFLLQIPHFLWNLGDHVTISQIDMIDLAIFEQQVNRSKLTIEFRLLQELLQFTVNVKR